MKKKNYLTLDDEFIQYCKLNEIDDVEKYAKEVFNKGFTLIKYGDKPIIKKKVIELPSNSKVELRTPSRQEVIDKWNELGILDGLNGKSDMDVSHFEAKVTKIMPVMDKRNKDIYDE